MEAKGKIEAALSTFMPKGLVAKGPGMHHYESNYNGQYCSNCGYERMAGECGTCGRPVGMVCCRICCSKCRPPCLPVACPNCNESFRCCPKDRIDKVCCTEEKCSCHTNTSMRMSNYRVYLATEGDQGMPLDRPPLKNEEFCWGDQCMVEEREYANLLKERKDEDMVSFLLSRPKTVSNLHTRFPKDYPQLLIQMPTHIHHKALLKFEKSGSKLIAKLSRNTLAAFGASKSNDFHAMILMLGAQITLPYSWPTSSHLFDLTLHLPNASRFDDEDDEGLHLQRPDHLNHCTLESGDTLINSFTHVDERNLRSLLVSNHAHQCVREDLRISGGLKGNAASIINGCVEKNDILNRGDKYWVRITEKNGHAPNPVAYLVCRHFAQLMSYSGEFSTTKAQKVIVKEKDEQFVVVDKTALSNWLGKRLREIHHLQRLDKGELHLEIFGDLSEFSSSYSLAVEFDGEYCPVRYSF